MSKKASSTPPCRTGVDALYLPVMTPDSSEAILQFQWMSLHPLTLIALSNAVSDQEQSTPASQEALQVSQTFPRYRRAVANKISQPQTCSSSSSKSMETDNTKSPITSDSFISPFLQASGMGVDLANLIEPPLISMSVPKFLDDDDDDDDDEGEETEPPPSGKRRCLDISTVTEKVNVKVQEALDNLATSAMSEMESNYKIETFELPLDDLSSLTETELRTLLSSQIVHTFLKKNYSERTGRGCVSGSSSEFFLLSLVLLAQFGANERMGRHVLQVLAPPVLSDCNDLLTNQSISVATRLFERLAVALVTNCSLGALPKQDLIELMPDLDDDDDDNDKNGSLDAMRELFCCLGEAYADAKKT